MEIIEHPKSFSAIHFGGGSLDSQTKNTTVSFKQVLDVQTHLHDVSSHLFCICSLDEKVKLLFSLLVQNAQQNILLEGSNQ